MFIEFLQVYLPIIINVLLVAVLIIAIIIGLKLTEFLDKTNHIVDSVSEKVDSLNGLFRAIDFATDKVNDLTTKAVDLIASGLSKVFHRKSKKQIKEDKDL